MQQLLGVHPLYGQANLGEPKEDFLLAEVLNLSSVVRFLLNLFVYFVFQRARISILHQDLDLEAFSSFRLPNVVHPYNVGMPQLPHHIHFFEHLLQLLILLLLTYPRDDGFLQSPLGSIVRILNQFDSAEASLTESAQNSVLRPLLPLARNARALTWYTRLHL